MRKSSARSYGQSLLEAVVGTALVTLVLTGLVSALTYSLSNAQNARQRAFAAKLVQETVEWLRQERDLNWAAFYNRATDASTVYCIQAVGSWPGAGSCSAGAFISGTNMKREMVLAGNGTYAGPPVQNQDRVDVTLRVYWLQGTSTADVTINTSLTKW